MKYQKSKIKSIQDFSSYHNIGEAHNNWLSRTILSKHVYTVLDSLSHVSTLLVFRIAIFMCCLLFLIAAFTYPVLFRIAHFTCLINARNFKFFLDLRPSQIPPGQHKCFWSQKNLAFALDKLKVS